MRRVTSLSALLVAGLLLPALPAPASHAPPAPFEALAVVAHIDTGINPYHHAFRDASARGFQHPCTYLPRYPCSAEALHLSLDAASYEEAVSRDVHIWGSETVNSTIVPGRLYWIPGTRIVGAMKFSPFLNGGTNCPVSQVPPLSYFNSPLASCIEHPILDDHGHGTMTASRMAGNPHSLCPTCRVVSIEGLSPDAVLWAANSGWIDAQTNSWADLVPPPVNQALQPVWDLNPELRDFINGGNSTAVRVKEAAQKMPVFFASGNGAAFILGFAPTPTYALSTGPPGAILVGAHDNGQVTVWHGSPVHVAADAYRGVVALRDSLTAQEPAPISCCTSSSSPYAAGGGAGLILEARRILHAPGSGVVDGIIARAPCWPSCVPPAVPAHGPLSDGELNLSEFKSLYFHTAQARPVEGKDDGAVHWVGALPDAPPLDLIASYGPGGNPFCNGCWTLPAKWRDVPPDVQQFPLIGYGGINEHSLAHAARVLAGHGLEPERGAEDQLYALDQQVRAVVFATA